MLKVYESRKTSIVLVISAILGMVLAGTPANAQTAGAFTATDLAGVSAIVVAFLAVGAAITIAMTLYRKGRQGAGKV